MTDPLRTMRRAAVLATLAALLPACAEQDVPRSLDALLARHPAAPILGSALGEDGGVLTFLVAGHLYGEPGGTRTLPAASFVAHFDELAANEPDLVVLLGDFVRRFRDDCLRDTLGVLEGFAVPVYNAPGNHDMTPREAYVERFGATWGGFRVGASLFLVLDTELDPWRITGAQLEFLRTALETAPEAGIERAFVFAHRMLFAADDERYAVLFHASNSRADWPGSSNFQSDVRPLLARFAAERDLTWFSGDVGANQSFGLFHEIDERTGVRYVATGMGERAWDNVVRVELDVAGRTVLEAIPLAASPGSPGPSLDEASLSAWLERYPPPRRARQD